jgi:hypothetical protein
MCNEEKQKDYPFWVDEEDEANNFKYKCYKYQ